MPDRKTDHLHLTFLSQLPVRKLDKRFYYEPATGILPVVLPEIPFVGKVLKAPIWISSMTGGAKKARQINRNLARVCGEFGLGMGLGSVRALLENPECIDDFAMRKYAGDDVPLFANLGIFQVSEAVKSSKKMKKIRNVVDRLGADGLIIHVNPLQEFFQPGGDLFTEPAVDSIKRFLDLSDLPLIVKEVGQGMGPLSLKALLSLPLAALEFGAFGGTNFSMLEYFRNRRSMKFFKPLTKVGVGAEEMVGIVNTYLRDGVGFSTNHLIISGGIKNFLDGYYFISSSVMPSIYGMAAGFLKFARKDYDALRVFTSSQINGLKACHAYLSVRSPSV